MKRIVGFSIIVVLVVAFSIFRLVFKPAEINESQISKEQALSIYRKVKQTMGLPKEESKLYRRIYYDEWDRREIVIIDDGILDIEIDRKTGEIVRFFNWQVYQSLEKKQEKFPEIKATKTEEEILKLAENYIKLITGKSPPSNYIPKIKYCDKGYCRGEWRITYRRVLNGYLYEGGETDWFRVRIADYSGELISFVKKPESETCPTEVKISEEKAKEIACKLSMRFARALSRMEGVRVSRKEWAKITTTVFSCKLQIVHPNHFFRIIYWWISGILGGILHGELPSLYTQTLKSRLAYVVRVKIQKEGVIEVLKVKVYVDAETGKVLCRGLTGNGDDISGSLSNIKSIKLKAELKTKESPSTPVLYRWCVTWKSK